MAAVHPEPTISAGTKRQISSTGGRSRPAAGPYLEAAQAALRLAAAQHTMRSADFILDRAD
jgi:hypothetical protein